MSKPADTSRRARRGMLLVAGALALGACSAEASIGGNEVPQDDLEAFVATELAEQSPNAPAPIIDCPGGLEAEVGATIECDLTVEGDDTVLPAYVEVNRVEDGIASFDIEVGQLED